MKAASLLLALLGAAAATDEGLVRVAMQKRPLTAADLNRTAQLASRAAATNALLGSSSEADIPLLDYLDAQVYSLCYRPCLQQ